MQKRPSPFVPRGDRFLFWIFLAALPVALFSLRYVAMTGPLLSPMVLANRFADPWLPLHAGAASLALLVGSFQFLSGPWLGRARWHRRAGQVFVAAAVVGSVSGFALALGAVAGPVARVGFGLLALAWGPSTLFGWWLARRGEWARHRGWMIRAWALTLAAITLRLYLLVLPMIPVDPVAGYQAISFLAWVPNLLIAEYWLRRRTGQSGYGSNSNPASEPCAEEGPIHNLN